MLRRLVLASAIVLLVAAGAFADIDQSQDFSVGAAHGVTLTQAHEPGQGSHTITINNQQSAMTLSGLWARPSRGGISSVEEGTVALGSGAQDQRPLATIQQQVMLVGLTQAAVKIGSADGAQGFQDLIGGQTLMASSHAARMGTGGQNLHTAQQTRVVGGRLEERLAHLAF
jgi:hypothetical protein